MADIYPPDTGSEIGVVRTYIPDSKLAADPADLDAEPSYIFSDDEIQAFITGELLVLSDPVMKWHLWRAAAMAMITIANNENLTLKKIVTEDLQTDGPAVADKLIKAANLLFARADKAENAADAELFIDVPYVHTPPRYYPLTPLYLDRWS